MRACEGNARADGRHYAAAPRQGPEPGRSGGRGLGLGLATDPRGTQPAPYGSRDADGIAASLAIREGAPGRGIPEDKVARLRSTCGQDVSRDPSGGVTKR